MKNLIPKPFKMTEGNEVFILDANTGMQFDAEFKHAQSLMQSIFLKRFGAQAKKGKEVVFVKEAGLEREGYRLRVAAEGVRVTASDDAGALYAVQTIRQLGELDAAAGGKILLPAMQIEDKPRFNWRGLLLDEARHFFGKEEVKRLLDMMSVLKLNVLHWHLTDDQGWRIEIKKYPLLTEVGSKRKDTHIHGWRKSDMRGEPHSGFYTQEEAKEIVGYAQSLGIMVYPEIDMPAHFRAAFAAYPWLACVEKPSEVPHYFGAPAGIAGAKEDVNRIACAGKETTYEFIYHVIDELCEIFPAPYFHIGGDEAPKSEWTKCPHCQAKMKENDLKDEEALQGYFNNQVAAYLRTKGKSLIGWNEILTTDNLDQSVIAQYWVPAKDQNAINWANKGNKLIMSKHQSFYFDMCYNQYPLQNTYRFEPELQGIKPEAEKNIVGLEGALWTEWVADREKLEMQIYPRLQALSEVAWTAKGDRDFDDFLARYQNHKRLLEAFGINYAEDKIAMPKGKIRRLRKQLKWYESDQYFEVRQNRELKAKK